MIQEIEVALTPESAGQAEAVKQAIASALSLDVSRIVRYDLLRRSIDARQRTILVRMAFRVSIDKEEPIERHFTPAYHDVSDRPTVIVAGAGPAGLFAALRLIELNLRPLVLERGKSVDDRKVDLKALYSTGHVDPDSNVCYGEGGAGTFSDGKLYTRSKKRGDNARILEIFVHHGADEHILTDAHPHIGSNRLPDVIARMRKTITDSGGEIRFNTRITDLIIDNNKIKGVMAGDEEIIGKAVILATGHSARDIYQMLYARNIPMEQKAFAVGVRMEHPQALIDSMQYHTSSGRGNYLPPAEYFYSTQVVGRGVYTFCMCPGGVIIPTATSDMEQVVNGMSCAERNTPWANSALVTAVGEEELAQMNYTGLLGGMQFQEELEQSCRDAAKGHLKAPGQRITDFMHNRCSADLPKTSYKPGAVSVPVKSWFPQLLHSRLQLGLGQIGRSNPALLSSEGLLLGVESRTSSPLRIIRDPERLEHPTLEGLFPCGEGAGYAGGIVSSATDGERSAEAVARI